MPNFSAPQPWRGRTRLGLGWGWFNGTAGDNQPHAHHAIQILIADSPQMVWTAETGWEPFTGAIIGADVCHQLAPTREAVSLIYVEADSDIGMALSARAQDGVSRLTKDELQQVGRRLLDSHGSAPDEWLVSVLVNDTPMLSTRQRDERISQVIASLPTALPKRFTAGTMAAQAGLSRSHFQHRFRAHTGMALRPYLRWRRLLTAMAAMVHGESITESALMAGFSDAAHFTRTVRQHFGITPRALGTLGDS